MKKLFFIFLIVFVSFGFVSAQENFVIDYGDGLVLDSDLDGLTDLGETQKFGTDPQDQDSDGDGLLDGAEIISGLDALDPAQPSSTKVIKEVHSVEGGDTPWTWYLTRSFGLIAFILLYLSVVFGLAMRIPKLNTLAEPIFALDFHKWLSVQAILFALTHGLVLLFDKTIEFGWNDIFIPFHTEYQSTFTALGIISLYLMLILTLTSYFRRFVNRKLWRFIHYFNIIIYFGVSIHMWYLGTDLKLTFVRVGFVLMNLFLVFLIGLNIVARIRSKKMIQVQ